MKVNFLVISVELDRFIRPAISYIKADEREAIIHMITTSENCRVQNISLEKSQRTLK